MLCKPERQMRGVLERKLISELDVATEARSPLF